MTVCMSQCLLYVRTEKGPECLFLEYCRNANITEGKLRQFSEDVRRLAFFDIRNSAIKR